MTVFGCFMLGWPVRDAARPVGTLRFGPGVKIPPFGLPNLGFIDLTARDGHGDGVQSLARRAFLDCPGHHIEY